MEDGWGRTRGGVEIGIVGEGSKCVAVLWRQPFTRPLSDGERRVASRWTEQAAGVCEHHTFTSRP